MDPLSVAGSVAGLISLADTVFRKLFRYVKDVKNAEKDAQDLKSEVAALSGVLHNLHVVAQDLEADQVSTYSTRTGHVNSCLATLYKLDEILDKIGVSDRGKLRNTIHKLSWPFKSVNTKQFIEDIRQHRNNINLALSADCMTALLKCLSTQDELLKRVDDIDTRRLDKERIETRITMDLERQRILDYFLFVNPHENFKTSLKLRYPTTGFWLTENEIFSAWLRGTTSHLWLSGIPGAGKTVLSSLIIQECMNWASTERAVAFFYCDYKSLDSQNSVNILASIASQLARQNENSFQILKKYHTALHPQNQLKQSPELEQLIQLLRSMSSTFEDVRIVVDGLDECGSSTVEVLEALKSVIHEHETISIALLSRDEVEIREELGPPVCAYIEIAAHTKDIEHFVRSEIENRIKKKKLRVKSVELKDEIVLQLVSRAQGMFRWVSCQLDHLCELPTDALRRKALTQLPKTLHETYDRILMRVQEHSVALVHKTLQWIMYAERKLTVEELVEIVSLEDDDDTLDFEAYPDPEDLLRSCGSLIRKAHGCLELAHFTVQEFLEAIQPGDERLSMFQISSVDRIILAKACVSYLCLRTFDQPPLMLFERDDNEYPFYRYASRYFVDYTASYQDDLDFFEQIQELFDPKKSYNFTFLILEHLDSYASSLSDYWKDSVCSQTFGPLHAAAMLHMHKICQWLIDQNCEVNKVSNFGMPLECAIYGARNAFDLKSPTRHSMRHLRERAAQVTISVLLHAGSACDRGTVHGHSLISAVANGPWDPSILLAMMLEHGMPLEPDVVPIISSYSDGEKQSFFHVIDELKDKIIISPEVKIRLLDFAHTNSLKTAVAIPFGESMTDETFSEALRHAVRFNQISAFEKLVVDSKSSVELAWAGEDGTYLHFAARNHSVQILHMLLDLGCDPTVPGKRGRSVLHDVIRLGMVNKRLLSRLISSEAAKVLDRQGRSVWHEAASIGNLQALQLLFEIHGSHTALLHQPCKNGYTPIIEAILGQHTECAEVLLLETYTDNTIVADERTLHYAVAMGLASLLTRLRDCGAELCAVSSKKQTVLYSLTSFTKSDTMDLLLSCGLDRYHLDASGRSPLVAFLALDERQDHLRLSLIKGAEKHVLEKSVFEALADTYAVATKDIDGHTAWFYFCTRMVPFIVSSIATTFGKTYSQEVYLRQLLSVLVDYEAWKVYEDVTGTSGVVLLVKTCLDSAPKCDTTWELMDASQKKSAAISAVLIDILNKIYTAGTPMDIANDAQIIRLLAWSVAASQGLLIKRLLELGVDVHSVSEYHQGKTPIDESIVLDLVPDILDLLLERADNSRLLTVDETGSFRHFCLCFPNPVWSKYRIRKLEALLEAGVDPDARAPNSRTLAHDAAEAGSLTVLQLLVRFKADLSLVDMYGWTVIQYALEHGDMNLLRFVREHLSEDQYWTATFPCRGPVGQPHNIASGPLPVEAYFGCSLLHLGSVCSKSTDILNFLKETGCFNDMDVKSHEGVTPLHFAACMRSPATVRWLISNGANVHIDVGAKRRTALHYALQLGYLESALVLIEAGATFASDSDGFTPEMRVHPQFHGRLMAALPHCGVSVPPSVLENLRSDHGLRPVGGLHRAISEGDYEACLSVAQSGKRLTKSMLECGACTPLLIALASGRLDIAKVFLLHGATTDGLPCAEVRRMGQLFDSALNIAISQPIFNPILEKLLELTLRYESHWSQGSEIWQPLHLAAAFNAKSIETILSHVKKNTNLITIEAVIKSHPGNKHGRWTPFVEIRSPSEATRGHSWLVPGGTALHIAACNKNSDALDILAAYGADMNAKAFDGRTPLHYAVNAGCITSTAKLLQHGATPRCLDSNRLTPFALASVAGKVELMSILFPFENDKTAMDIHGRTALHHAAQKAQLQAFIYLLDAGWDPYQLDRSLCSPIYYAISHPGLATYIHAKHLDISHLAADLDKRRELPLLARTTAARCFYIRLPKPARLRFLNTQATGQITPLMKEVIEHKIESMRILILAGADLEVCDPALGTALTISCHSGQLSSVRFLVRQGAKLDCKINGRVVTALQAASSYLDIIHWFLVDQYLDQGKITNDSEHENEVRPWSGVRNVQIPLRGRYERPLEVSLEDHARDLHSNVISRDGWRVLVPLGWDTVAHFTSLPAELGHRTSA